MQKAAALARRGAASTSPNPPVGAVLVRDGKLIGSDFHKQAGSPHAEIEALRTVADASGSTLYVTLEPCNHSGKTPPCTEAIIDAGVKRVVVGLRDPNLEVAGGGIERLTAAGLDVEVGVAEAQCEATLEPWLHWLRSGRPLVTLKLAVTADQKLVAADGRWVTGSVARAEVHRLRSRVDAVLIGRGTLVADDPLLSNRSGRGQQPLRIVLDTDLSVSSKSALLSEASLALGPVLLVCKKGAAQSRKDELTAAGVELLEVHTTPSGLDLEALLDQLGARAVRSVMCEGGYELAENFLKQELCDYLLLHQSNERGEAGAPALVELERGLRLISERRMGKDTRKLLKRK